MWSDAPGIFPADLKNNVAYRSEVQGLELPPKGLPYFAGVQIGS